MADSERPGDGPMVIKAKPERGGRLGFFFQYCGAHGVFFLRNFVLRLANNCQKLYIVQQEHKQTRTIFIPEISSFSQQEYYS